MPFKPKHPCSYSGCPKITSSRFCEKHERSVKKKSQQYDRERDQTEERQWIHSPRWRKASRMFLDEHPLCAECERKGRTTGAYLVDHIESHRGDHEKFWNQSNWQSMCGSCHSSKTNKEDGGYGNPPGAV